MISSTFGGYMTAKLGLFAAQHGLHLTGQNLTNAGTPGYTRQVLDQVSINYGGSNRYASRNIVNIGNGVLVKGTSQLRDPFLDLRYRNEVAHFSEQGVKLDVLNDLRDILDEVKNAGDDSLGDGGIFNQIGDIIEKFEKYTSEIGSKEFDSMVKASCQSLVTLFNSYSKRIEEVETNLNYDMETAYIPDVNSILKSIQDLNKSIRASEVIGQSALELKDERNLLIDQLSNYMKINVTYKPVSISASTVIDELHISMVGRDGKNYELIADEQRREFILSKDGDKTNVGLGPLSPIDQELVSKLNTAQLALERAQNVFDNRNETFADAYNEFADVKEHWENLADELAQLRTELGDPDDKNPDGTALYKKMQDATAAHWEALLEYEGKDPADRTEEELEKLIELRDAKDAAVKEYNDKKTEIRAKEREIEKYQETYDASKAKYQNALANLDTNPLTGGQLLDKAGNPLKDKNNADITTDLLTGDPLAGQNLAQNNLAEAKENVQKALDALAQSEAKGAAVESVNELLTDGILKGALEMLNYSAEYDDPPNTIRGIGYYKNMLDTLANKFAEAMNQANNPYEFTVQKTGTDKDGNSYLLYTNYDYNEDSKTYTYNGKIDIDSNGSLVYDPKDTDKKNPLDKDKKPIYQLDSKGNPIYDKDTNGQTIYIDVKDENGNPVYEMEPDGQGGFKQKEEVVRDDNGNIVYKTDANGKPLERPVLDENGNPVKKQVYEQAVDDQGNKIFDKDGNPVMVPAYEKDANGQYVLDNNGNKIPVMEEVKELVPETKPVPLRIPAPKKEADMETVKNEDGTAERHDLFKSRDGGKITAGTIDLADGWVNNSYGITTALNENDPSGNNTNVLHFINMLNGKLNYKADVDLMDQIQINFNTPAGAASKEPNLTGLKEGDTVTIDGKTYTYTKGATGESGNEFSDFETLKKAASKNGVDLTQDADGVLSATTATQTFRPYDVQVNGETISSFANIKPENMKYGDTITIDGNTFTYKPKEDANGKPVADPGKGEFSDMDSLIALAQGKNIEITTDGQTPPRITGMEKIDGQNVGVSVDKEPGIGSMVTGNTITIGDPNSSDSKTFTFVDPAEVDAAIAAGGDATFNGVTFTFVTPDPTATPPVVADPAKGEFSDLESLKAAMAEKQMFSDAQGLQDAAEKQSLTVYVDPKTNQITSATKPGSKIFDGTFEEYYVSLDATLGLDIKHTTEKADNYGMLAGSIADEREAATGVNHDEEAMNLMRYQQSYVAASRMMTTLDQVLEILLTQTGMVGR